MDNKFVFNKVDHTLLGQTSTWDEIKQICDDAIIYQVASVCIPPSFVKEAKEYVLNECWKRYNIINFTIVIYCEI